MIEIHFQANFLPKQKKFRVEVTAPGFRTVELMTVAQFIRFARQKEGPMTIGGRTIVFDGVSEEEENAIRVCFKEVADSYMRWKGYFPNPNSRN